jgi:DNA-binding XRE family transcriptional regulator
MDEHYGLEKTEFIQIRRYLGKTQKEMAQLLGISLKAVQSFEQGWRNIPVHVERQVLFLMGQKHTANRKLPVCWEDMDCPEELREKCPAWEFNTPTLCWFINGTVCGGKVHANWREKMKQCRKCKVFRSQLPTQRKLKAASQ